MEHCFSRCEFFPSEGFVVVERDGKYNLARYDIDKHFYADKDEDLLSDEWFDYVIGFFKGFAIVKRDKEYNFIDKKGELLCKKWFDGANVYDEDFLAIKKNGKWNFINEKRELLSNEWFEGICCCGDNKTADVLREDGKLNVFHKDKGLLSDEWSNDLLSLHTKLDYLKSGR